MKIAVIYYSFTHNTEKVADIIINSIYRHYDSIEVKKFTFENIDYMFLKDCSGVIFGSPTYYGNVYWKISEWFENSKNINLEGKLGAAFSTANYIQGGGEIALQTLNNFMIVKGMLVYTSGSTLGKPYIHLGPIILNFEESNIKIIESFSRKFAKKCLDIFNERPHLY